MPIEPGQGDASREHTPYTYCRGALAGGHDAELISRARPGRTREKGMAPQVPGGAPQRRPQRGASQPGAEGTRRGLSDLSQALVGRTPCLLY